MDTFFSDSVNLNECQNRTVVNNIEQQQTQWQIIIIIISGLMNGLLIIVVIGKFFIYSFGFNFVF